MVCPVGCCWVEEEDAHACVLLIFTLPTDGLTVPFALAAGLSSLGDSKIVVYGGAAGKKKNKKDKRVTFLNSVGLTLFVS